MKKPTLKFWEKVKSELKRIMKTLFWEQDSYSNGDDRIIKSLMFSIEKNYGILRKSNLKIYQF